MGGFSKVVLCSAIAIAMVGVVGGDAHAGKCHQHCTDISKLPTPKGALYGRDDTKYFKCISRPQDFGCTPEKKDQPAPRSKSK